MDNNQKINFEIKGNITTVISEKVKEDIEAIKRGREDIPPEFIKTGGIQNIEDLKNRRDSNLTQDEIDEGFANIRANINVEGENTNDLAKFTQSVETAISKVLTELDSKLNRIYTKVISDKELFDRRGKTLPKSSVMGYERQVSGAIDSAQAKIDEAMAKGGEIIGTDSEAYGQYSGAMSGIKEKLSGQKDDFKLLADTLLATPINEEPIKGFIDTLMKLGTATMVLGSIAKYLGTLQQRKVTEAGISAQYETAFELSSPVGTYTDQLMAKVNEITSRRSQETSEKTSLISSGTTIAGTVVGAKFGGAVGGLAGAQIGGMIGDLISGSISSDTQAENTRDQAEAQAEAKFIGQMFSVAERYVQKYRQYDIARVLNIARLGKEAGGYTTGSMGYSKMEDINLKSAFGDSYGRYDEGLFKRQTMFAKAGYGNPNEIYGLNKVAQMTGVDFDLDELNFGKETAEGLYGTGMDKKKAVDVLSSIKDLMVELLDVNVNVDVRRANQMALLPRLLMGENSAYGKIDQMGGKTIGYIEQLMKPKGNSDKGWLMSILGKTNYVDFQESLKQGMFGDNTGENMSKVFTGLSDIADNFGEDLLYGKLDKTFDGAPAEMITKFVELFKNKQIEKDRYSLAGNEYAQDDNGDYVRNTTGGYEKINDNKDNLYVTLKDFTKGNKEAQLEISNLSKKYGSELTKAIAKSTSVITNIENQQLAIGGKWNSTIANSEIKMNKIFSDLSSNGVIIQKMGEAITEGFKKMESKFAEENYKIALNDRNEKIKETAETLESIAKNWASNNGATGLELGWGELGGGSLDTYKKNLMKALSGNEILKEKFGASSDNGSKLTSAIADKVLTSGTMMSLYQDINKLNMELKKYLEELKKLGYKTNATTGEITNKPKAIGGSVNSGEKYLIGEEGSEIFVPDSGGKIISNSEVLTGAINTNDTLVSLANLLQNLNNTIISVKMRQDNEAENIYLNIGETNFEKIYKMQDSDYDLG